ncbi:MAG: dephospho-CoA kinase [Rickettsiales bacterium]|nr:dephospho-CoA kinase [Rickettsiales bacterium]
MIIGLIGLMGSGKSTVGEYLVNKNFTVINLDKLSHKVYEKGSKQYEEIIQIWGNNILDNSLQINRVELSKKVFEGDGSSLDKLQSIVWPKLEEILQNTLNELNKEEIIFIEGAQIVKSGFNKYCDELWCIVASIENIKSRLEENNSPDFLNRLKIQIEDYALLSNINEFIYNDSTKQELNNNVQFLLERIRKEF